MYTCYIYIYICIFFYIHMISRLWYPHILGGYAKSPFQKGKTLTKTGSFFHSKPLFSYQSYHRCAKKRFPQENWWNKGWFSTSKGLQESNWPELDDGNPGVSPGIYHPRSILSGGSEVGAERQYGCSVRNWNCWGGVAWRRRWDSHGIDGLFIDGLPIKNGDFP